MQSLLNRTSLVYLDMLSATVISLKRRLYKGYLRDYLRSDLSNVGKKRQKPKCWFQLLVVIFLKQCPASWRGS